MLVFAYIILTSFGVVLIIIGTIYTLTRCEDIMRYFQSIHVKKAINILEKNGFIFSQYQSYNNNIEVFSTVNQRYYTLKVIDNRVRKTDLLYAIKNAKNEGILNEYRKHSKDLAR